MSHQPSQAEVARQTTAEYATSAAQTVVEIIDPSRKKDDDQSKKEPSLKEKLDRAAYGTAEEKKEETYLEKGMEVIIVFKLVSPRIKLMRD